MKKISLVLLALSISILTLAQNSGDTGSQPNGSGWENEFYIRFAYSLPTTSYLGVGDDDQDFWDFFTRNGGAFELGHIFILNKEAQSNVGVGINVDYAEVSYHHLYFSDEDFNLGLLKVSSKIGPSVSFSPASKLVFDVFVKAKIPWVAGIVTAGDEVDDVYLAGPGFGVATGINLRYRFIMLGFEFNTDKMKFENQDFPGEYFGSISEDGDKTPMPSLSFSLGFCF